MIRSYSSNDDPSEVFPHFGFEGEKKLIGILPGSRSREVATHLPLMLEAAERIQAERNNVPFVIVRASSVDPDLIQRLVADSNIQVKVVDTYRYNVRSAMDFAIVVSGTATLETGLLLCSMIILYKMNALTWYIGQKMIELPDVGLINVVAGKRIVPELIGQHCTTANIAGETLRLLGNPEEMEEVRSQLGKVQEEMGGPGGE